MTAIEHIAIDGPVASGKTVIGKHVAKKLGFQLLDTGMMYRAATWVALRRGIELEHQAALSKLTASLRINLCGQFGEYLFVDGEDISPYLRNPVVEQGVPLVSKVLGVRLALVKQQQIIAKSGSLVMVGRDIGTVVLPKALLKIFLTASVEVRALRRHQESLGKSTPATYESVLKEITQRDRIDSERDQSPLRTAADAVVIATDEISVPGLANQVLKLAAARGMHPATEEICSGTRGEGQASQ